MYNRNMWIPSLLGIAIILSGCKSQQNGQMTQQEQESSFSYLHVLESTEEKIFYTGGDIEDSQALLYDLNGDGVEELLLCYLYNGGDTAFEVWTTANETPVQLCAVSDLGNIAGNGSYGMSLTTDNSSKHLCLWYQNSESSPPGSTSQYSVSMWEISRKVIFPYGPQRLEWTIYRTDSNSELVNSYGPGSENYLLKDYENMIEEWISTPEKELLGTNSSEYLTIDTLMGQLK